MKPSKEMKNLLNESKVSISSEKNNRILSAALLVYERTQKERRALSELNIWRTVMKNRITKLAVAAVIVMAVLISISHFGVSIDGSHVAFGDVLEQISKAQNVTYTQITYSEDKQITQEVIVTNTGLKRVDTQFGSLINDLHSGKGLQLMPGIKTAYIRYKIGEPRERGLSNYLEWMRTMHEISGEFVCQEEVTGILTNKYICIKDEFNRFEVWVDPAMNLPVQIKEVRIKNPDIIVPRVDLSTKDFGGDEAQGVSRSLVWGGEYGIQPGYIRFKKNFVWNAALDESLLSLEPPVGYEVKKRTLDVSKEGEHDLITAFSHWLDMSGGLFPSDMNDLGDPDRIRLMLIEKFDRDGDPEEELNEAMQCANNILKGLYFAHQRKVEGTWHYDGRGVCRDDVEVPVCWWKREGSEGYRVIYGNLSIVDSNEMPQLP